MAPDTAADTAADPATAPDHDGENAPTISLIMTVRDGARYLSHALESALAQTFGDWGLIVWDDGSADATLDIARSFADRDARIRVFSEPALGRRRALALAHRRARVLGTVEANQDSFDHGLSLLVYH